VCRLIMRRGSTHRRIQTRSARLRAGLRRLRKTDVRVMLFEEQIPSKKK
jgi:hypothetical protein